MDQTIMTAEVADSFSSVNISGRDTPVEAAGTVEVENEPLTMQNVEQVSDLAMTEGTEQEDEEMETTPAVVELDSSEAGTSQAGPEKAQADKVPILQGLDVAQLTPEEREGLTKTFTKLQKLNITSAFDPCSVVWDRNSFDTVRM